MDKKYTTPEIEITEFETEDVITTLQKIRGYYLNWKDEFLAASDLLDQLGKMK